MTDNPGPKLDGGAEERLTVTLPQLQNSYWSSPSNAFQGAISEAITKLSPGGLMECPLDKCPWAVNIPEPTSTEMSEDLSHSNRYRVTMSGALASDVERVLEYHFATHPLTEWAREVAGLRGRMSRQDDEIRDLKTKLATAELGHRREAARPSQADRDIQRMKDPGLYPG